MSTETTAHRPKVIRQVIAQCFKACRPLMIWGAPGIGKSDLIATVGREWNRPSDLDMDAPNPNARFVIDLRLLLMEPTDIKGIPYYDPASQTMKWSPSSELPTVVDKESYAEAEAILAESEANLASFMAEKVGETELHLLDAETAERLAQLEGTVQGHKAGLKLIKSHLPMQDAILFLDEINAAPPSVQAAAYQLILNRRIGEYVLPEGVSIVAAGNRETDKGVTYRMPTPLANRFVHVEMEHNFKDWQNWAISAKVHPEVIGFLTNATQHLFTFDPKSASKAFATPRTWHYVSDLISDDNDDSLNEILVGGCVGEGLAIEFMQHRRFAAKMPNPEDVLKGIVKNTEIEEVSALYSLAISMCYRLKDFYKVAEDQHDKSLDNDGWHEMVDNFFAFMMKNFSKEMVILGAKTALRDYGLPIKHKKLKNFEKFYEQYGKYVLED